MRAWPFSVSLLIAFLSTTGLLRSQSELLSTVRALEAHSSMKTGQLSLSVVDINSNRSLVESHPHQSLSCASTLKLVTTATALISLGENHRFITKLEHDGEIKNGILRGNLYITGGGDPTLGSDQMEEALPMEELLLVWQKAILQAGIQEIRGDIIADASIYGSEVAGRQWEWSDLGNYYATGAWGLNLHENFYYLYFQQPPRPGMPCPIHSVSPEVPELELNNEVIAAGAGTGDNAYIFGAPYGAQRYIRGTLPAGNGLFPIKGALPDPPLFAAFHLYRSLASCGISITGQASSLRRENRLSQNRRKVIHEHASPPLLDIIRRANQMSVNLYCEALLREMGRVHGGAGTANAGLKWTKRFWKDRGLPLQGFFMQDGSGLSRSSALSASHLSQLLRKLAADERTFEAFRSSLSVAGEEGTLKYMLRGTDASGKVYGKSGTLERVRAYAGYVYTRSGKWVSFCLIANNFSGSSRTIRTQMEKILLAIYRL